MMVDAMNVSDQDLVIIVPTVPEAPMNGGGYSTTYIQNTVVDYASANMLSDALRRRLPGVEVLILQSMPEVLVMGHDAADRMERARGAVCDLQKVKEGLS